MNLAKQPSAWRSSAPARSAPNLRFYNAIGTQVTLIEMLDNILPIEDTDVSTMLSRIFDKRGIDVRAKTKTKKSKKSATACA